MYKTLLKWTPAQPARKPDNIISSLQKPLFQPLYLQEPTEDIRFLMSNEYMRMWFKEKAVYDKNTYIREQIIRDECKIKRRNIQRMATYRRPAKNHFIEEYVHRKIKRVKTTAKDQAHALEKMKFKPACPKIDENKKKTGSTNVKSKLKNLVDRKQSKVQSQKEDVEESESGCEIVVRLKN